MLHTSSFEYLKPTDMQLGKMASVRTAFLEFVSQIDKQLPEGPDKTHVMRTLRTAAMWANACITRQADGSPRQDE